MSEDTELIHISMEQAKQKIAISDALASLENSEAFKLIFRDGYLRDYVARLASLKASMAMANDKDQAFLTRQIDAIGFFGQYMGYIHAEARVAREAIAADELELQRIAEEDSDGAIH